MVIHRPVSVNIALHKRRVGIHEIDGPAYFVDRRVQILDFIVLSHRKVHHHRRESLLLVEHIVAGHEIQLVVYPEVFPGVHVPPGFCKIDIRELVEAHERALCGVIRVHDRSVRDNIESGVSRESELVGVRGRSLASACRDVDAETFLYRAVAGVDRVVEKFTVLLLCVVLKEVVNVTLSAEPSDDSEVFAVKISFRKLGV